MHSWVERLAPHSHIVLSEAASAPALIRAAVSTIGGSACEWAVEAAHQIIAEVEVEFEKAGLSNVMTGQEGEAFEASLLTTLMAFHGGLPAAAISRPQGAAENVRSSARQGVPVGTLLRTVWFCHTRTQDALLSELEKLVAPADFMREMNELNHALYSYVDLYVRDLTTEYHDELLAWSGHIPAERLNAMNALLAGEPPSSQTERILGLRLTDRHLFATAWQITTRHPPEQQTQLSRYAARVGQLLGANTTLVLQHDAVTDFWWTFSTETRHGDLAFALQQAELPETARVAVGDPGWGLAGFLESHATAQQAARVGRRSSERAIWDYREVRLIALLCSDEAAARRFVHDELAGLAENDPKIADLRNTVRHFLTSGNSRLVAAKELNIAANTVAYRMARAGELLGRPATERAVETLLALDLARYFPDYLGE